MIALKDLRFRYPDSDFELSIERLDIARGDTVALIGPSGSGKTTLLNLIAGVNTADSGSVRVDGIEHSKTPEKERRAYRLNHVGMVFQNFELLDYLSVLDNILLPLRIGAATKITDAHRQRAQQIAQRVGISDKLQRYPQQLSQGERQRVAVSRALLLEPNLVLADEPTGNLDPASKQVVLQLLLDYARDHHATLVTATHDLALLDQFKHVVDFDSFSNAADICAA